MIKVEDLRVGNYIIFPDGKPHKIGSTDFMILITTDFKDTEPIELTEEILLKCPSIESRSTYPISYYLHNRIIFINDGLCYDYATRVKLPYLHTF